MNDDHMLPLYEALRDCNEVLTACEMDIEDCHANAAFWNRKAEAMDGKRKELEQAVRLAGDRISVAVTALTNPPLMLMMEAEDTSE